MSQEQQPAEEKKLTPETIKTMSRAEIIKLNRESRRGTILDTMWKEEKAQRLGQTSMIRQMTGGYFKPTSKNLTFLQRHRRMAKLYGDLSHKIREYDQKDIDLDQHTARHLRSLKTWLMYKLKIQEFVAAGVCLFPAIIFTLKTKAHILFKLAPYGGYLYAKESIAMFLLERRLLKDYKIFEERMLGLQGEGFDASQSLLARDMRVYLGKEE